MVATTGRRMKTSANRISAARRRVGAHLLLGPYGELRDAAVRDLHARRDALRDLDPAVAQVDAEHHLVLARDAVLDDEELGHPREHGHGAPRHRDGALVLPHDD